MSAIVEASKARNWAEAVDSSDDEPDIPTEQVTASTSVQADDAADDSDHDNSDLDDEEESDNEAPSDTVASRQTQPLKPKPAPVVQLSKKEREILRKKELEDLDEILSQFGLKTAVETASNTADEVAAGAVEDAAPDSLKSKSKKKKRSGPKASAQEDQSASSAPADIAGILKARTVKAKKSEQSVAVAEALKAATEDGKKKKKKTKPGNADFSY